MPRVRDTEPIKEQQSEISKSPRFGAHKRIAVGKCKQSKVQIGLRPPSPPIHMTPYYPGGRPSANAANSYLEFTACKSQKFGHWANIQPLLEKAKKLTIFIGNSASLRTFFLKNLEKFDYRFFRKQKLFSGPF
jgi:hypothetical protein